MHTKQLQKIHQKQLKSNVDFYTSQGIHVFFKDRIDNQKVDVEGVIASVESKIPAHLVSEIEMIIVGWFKEFEERNINAFYDSGTIYISNIQDDNEDFFDDIVHELSHAIESMQTKRLKKNFCAKESTFTIYCGHAALRRQNHFS